MPKVPQKNDYLRKPDWLKISLRSTTDSAEVEQIVEGRCLHTICTSGMCPNKAECWSRRTATFMILGDICTRNCRFCATTTGRPLPPDEAEPEQIFTTFNNNQPINFIYQIGKNNKKDYLCAAPKSRPCSSTDRTSVS